MANKINEGRLYGVISQILPDGEFVKCKPIFVERWIYSQPSTYYEGIHYTNEQSQSGISEFKEIDIRQYGKPVFLPASRKKIYDGNEYFIIFQPSKNHTKVAMQNYFKVPGISTSTCDDSYPRILNVGIQFPNKFVAYISDRELTEKELCCLLQ